jgi:hypothetical protein
MVQMMPQILASTNLPQDNHDNKELRGEPKTTMLACKIYGEIGHFSGECPEQCHRCNTSHSTRECPMTMVTCFLCDGTNHVPRECKFYFTVQQMNQQAREKLSYLLESTPKDRSPKAKMGAKDKEEIPNTIIKSCLTDRKQEHLPGNYTKKRERFPTAMVECQENEIRDLLALEIPTKKKKQKQDHSKILCFHCREQGHFADQCPERKHKAKTQGSEKKDLSNITCFKCEQKGHYSNQCPEKSTSTTVVDVEDQGNSKTKPKAQPEAINKKCMFINY